MSTLPPIEERLECLLALAAHEVRPCKSCGRTLYFVRHNNNKVAPYSADGINHYLQCDRTATEERTARILKQAAYEVRPCKACGATLYFVRHNTGKSAPYTIDGVNHFLDCPSADTFRKKQPEVSA